jgi:hypothetical protein
MPAGLLKNQYFQLKKAFIPFPARSTLAFKKASPYLYPTYQERRREMAR